MSNKCAICKTPASKNCSKCKAAFYCNVTHQKADWPTHKLVCGKKMAPQEKETLID